MMVFAHTTFSSSTRNFAHAQALSRMSSLSGRMILCKMSTAIYLYGFLNQSLGLILGKNFLDLNNGLYAFKN
jgi:hypothetical protein